MRAVIGSAEPSEEFNPTDAVLKRVANKGEHLARPATCRGGTSSSSVLAALTSFLHKVFQDPNLASRTRWWRAAAVSTSRRVPFLQFPCTVAMRRGAAPRTSAAHHRRITTSTGNDQTGMKGLFSTTNFLAATSIDLQPLLAGTPDQARATKKDFAKMASATPAPEP